MDNRKTKCADTINILYFISVIRVCILEVNLVRSRTKATEFFKYSFCFY